MFKINKVLKITGTVIVVGIITIYSFYQIYGFAKGPVLSITYPSSGMTMKKSLIEIRGFVKNASFITMNDNQIFINEKGKFSEKLLLLEGYNVIEVEVKDRFERIKSEKLELVYKP